LIVNNQSDWNLLKIRNFFCSKDIAFKTRSSICFFSLYTSNWSTVL